eukprot:tig00020930_g16024.t1
MDSEMIRLRTAFAQALPAVRMAASVVLPGSARTSAVSRQSAVQRELRRGGRSFVAGSAASFLPMGRFFQARLAQAMRVSTSTSAATTCSAAPSGVTDKQLSLEEIMKIVKTPSPQNNVTDYIAEKIGTDLHMRPNHPLGIIKDKIQKHFESAHPGVFSMFDRLPPIVSVQANFDDLLVPADHVSRSSNDTFYITEETILRCHTSAHQTELLRRGLKAFLCTGDVYRRDSIDATHYPVFHQMEGVRVFEQAEWEAAGVSALELAEKDLKKTLEGLVRTLFGEVEMRWVDAYFPFTEPSFELEIFFKGEWLEVLGCGVVRQEILDACGMGHLKGWAFGLGLERLAMVLFDIPDIRLFWSDDTRFTKQFTAGKITKFKSYSKFPPCYKDIAFWISPEFTENNFCELVRGIAGDLVEEVKMIDEFTHPKTGKTSQCFRISYRSMDRSLTDEEINDLQASVRERVASELKVELR